MRGGTAAAFERYVRTEDIPGQPVAIDTWGERIWQACSAGQEGSDCAGEATMMDWQTALAFCQSLDWGGSDDWRLPDVKELYALLDLDTQFPAIDTTLFPNTPFYGIDLPDNNAGQYWSGTGRSYNDFALYVGFSFGSSHFYIQSEDRHVRCIR